MYRLIAFLALMAALTLPLPPIITHLPQPWLLVRRIGTKMALWLALCWLPILQVRFAELFAWDMPAILTPFGS